MTVSINIGDFRHRVSVQVSTRTRGVQGTQIDTFSTLYDRWATVKETKDEKFTVDMRYIPGLIPTARKLLGEDGVKRPVNRIVHGTRILNIEDVLDMQALKQIMRLICTRDDETF